MCFGRNRRSYSELKKDRESSNVSASQMRDFQNSPSGFRRQYDPLTVSTNFTWGSQPGGNTSYSQAQTESSNHAKKRTIKAAQLEGNEVQNDSVRKVPRTSRHKLYSNPDENAEILSSLPVTPNGFEIRNRSTGSRNVVKLTSAEGFMEKSDLEDKQIHATNTILSSSHTRPSRKYDTDKMEKDYINYLENDGRFSMSSGKYALPENRVSWMELHVPGYQECDPDTYDAMPEAQIQSSDDHSYSQVLVERSQPTHEESNIESEDNGVYAKGKKRRTSSQPVRDDSETESDEEYDILLQHLAEGKKSQTISRHVLKGSQLEDKEDDDIARIRESEISDTESEIPPYSKVARNVLQVDNLSEVSYLKLLEGFELVNEDLCIDYMNDCLRELCGAIGNEPEHIRFYFPLKYAAKSPPYIFEVSDQLASYSKAYLEERRLFTSAPLEEIEKDIRRYSDVANMFFVPKIASAPNSPLRTLETHNFLVHGDDGAVNTKRASPFLYNMLRVEKDQAFESLWTRVSDIMDVGYPSPSLENPLPILSKCSNRQIPAANTPWTSVQFAPSEISYFLKNEHRRLREEYGPYSQLMDEQDQLSDCAVRAVSHLPECLARGDATGLSGIIEDMRKIANALEVLKMEDYLIKEKAHMSLPFHERKIRK